ncbi:hypothetical protein SASPL_134800 [Salvia splendens]|uniref:F-box domain-containing protein n=1 Tax=Salvia splendens TaxID=180675 RepID=A0A8X8WYW2_SALSN|nr:hypothetical protein SASPL_134800 [Salvia splendens]
MWAAEGFLNETECKSVEETGEEYVQDLVRRNLVSVCSRKSNGRIKSIEIEDFFMFDLCVKQGRVDSFSFRADSGFRSSNWLKELKSCRGRVSCRVDEFYKCPNFLKGVYGSTIRTLMLYMSKSQRGFGLSIGNVRLLRILDLSNARHYDLPKGVFELFHLRYLAFYCGFSISKAISDLVNLQTLIICPRESDSIFAEFPDGIWRMPQLRHLLVSSFKLPTHKDATSALVNLQTLCRVVNFICSRDNLKMVPNLKKLTLLYSLRDMVEDYELHNLIHLQKLETLKIEMDWSSGEQLKSMRCAFPPTLHKLSLSSVRLGWDDIRTVGLLPNLQVLKLRKHACTGDTWETSEGGFSQLTYLLIDESNLENWLTQTSHFPKLRSLLLRCCLRLLEVPNDIGQVPSLELIELDGQNNSLLRSANMIQKDRHNGKEQRSKQVIEVNDEKKQVKFKVIEGDVLKLYKNMVISYDVETKGGIDFATRTIEYELLKPDNPHPVGLLNFGLELSIYMMHEDRITDLPSDILVSIISRLTIHEATSTSILSSRWRHLHAYNTHLNFTKYAIGEMDRIIYRSQYDLDRVVNHVLNSHRGSRIKEFTFDLHRCGVFYEIERYFEFALTRKAEMIHISPGRLTFRRLPDRNGLECLKDLSLISIEMSDQYFQFVVSNCPILECLTVKNCSKLENVAIVGPSKLKRLNLSFLSGIRSMVIRNAISLVSLTCFECRRECSVQLSNIPKLTKLNLRDSRYSRTQVEFISQMPYCIRDQLQLLRLSYAYYSSSDLCKFVPWKMSDTTGEVEFDAKTYDHRRRCDLSEKYLEILGYSKSKYNVTFSNKNVCQNVVYVMKWHPMMGGWACLGHDNDDDSTIA